MKKLFFAVWMLLLASTAVHSQYLVSGFVYDENGDPLAGATLVLDEVRATVSNSSGNYEFSKVNGGVHNLKVSFIGYETDEVKLNVKENLKKDFKLVLQSHLAPEVIVSAYRAGSKTPMAYTNLSGDKMRQTGVNEDLPYLLQLTPSLVATSESGLGIGNTSFRIRGSDPTRINVTVNGVPLNDSEGQGVYWANMPDFSSSVNEVQVQRGVGTSTNGSAAFGATVNFRSGSEVSAPFAEGISSVGSYNTFKNSVKMSTGTINNKFSLEARYSDLQTDGYVRNAFADHESMFLSGTLHFDHSFLKMNVIHGDQTTGISWEGIPKEKLKTDRKYNPAGAYTDLNEKQQFYKDETDNYIQTHYQVFYSHAFSNKLDMTAALHYTRGDGFYEQYKENAKFSSYNLPNVVIGGETISRSDLIRQKWMENDFYGFVLSGNQEINDNLKLSVGGGWNQYDGDHFGKVIWSRIATNMEKDYQWYYNNGLKTDYSAFVKANFEFGKVGILLDMQYRGIDYKMKGEDDDLVGLAQNHSFDFFNPKAGVFVDIVDGLQAYASFGVANREPTRTNFKDAKGDPNAMPKSERLFDWEAGSHFQSEKFSISMNLFYMLYDDQLVPTGEKSNTGRDIMTNVKDSYRTGLELQWAVTPIHQIRWDGNVTLSQNKIRNYVETSEDSSLGTVVKPLGSTDIAYSPSVILSSALSYNFMKGAAITLNSKYVGEQFFDNTSSNDRKLDAYFVNDLKVRYGFSPQWMKKVELSAMVNNLFNLEYETNAYGGNWYESGVEKTWAYYYPMAPRHYMFQLLLRF